MMDKKIILSVLIVALIGIVAATYQINTGDILNPLASVETEEESPVTEVFTAPESQEDAQAKAEADAQAKAQADAQAQAEAKAKADAQAKQESQENTESQSVSAGTTQKSSLVGSGDTIVVQGSSSGGQSSSSDSGSDSGSNSASGSGSDSGSNSGSDNTVSNSGTDNTQSTSISSDMISTLKSVLEPIIDSSILSLEMDKGVLEDNLYKIPATYKDTGKYAGTFYVDQSDLNNWYYIDSQNNYYTAETPFPGKIDNGALVTE